MNKALVILLLMMAPVYSYSQDYELYTGAVFSEDHYTGYMIGANYLVDLKQGREYLDKMLFGFEHSAYMSGNTTVTPVQTQTPNTTVTTENCQCELSGIGFGNGEPYTAKKETRAVSLNLGVEIFKGKRLYFITGVTNYQHIFKVNNQKISETRSMQIDAGIKYYIKIKHWYFSPTFKFNPETISAGLGVSWK